MKIKLLIIVFFIVSQTLVSAQNQSAYVITDVTLIPMTYKNSIEHQTVLIENGKIKQFANVGKVKIPKNAIVIDGKGKFLMPGLYDMHAHFYYDQGEHVNTIEHELKLMLSQGLTTVRIQNGHPLYLESREKVKKQEWAGPELIVSSPQFVGRWLEAGEVMGEVCKTPEEGEKAVRKYKALGYDQIKITTMLKRDVYDAVVKTAKEENIKITGHIGPLVKLPAALAAHQQIEHMDEFIEALLPDTSYNHGQSVSDFNLWRRKAWETVPYLDENKIPALVKSVKDANVYVTPTNYFFISFFGKGIDEDKAKQTSPYQFIPSYFKTDAANVRAQYYKNLPSEENRQKYIKLRKAMTYALWKGDVKLMAGSDSPQWYAVTGFTLHDELETFVECGLTPFAALQTATVNPAAYLNKEGQSGTIEPGKEAKLLLLDKNPLQDIRNTRTISGIFSSGKWYDKASIDRLLEEAMQLSK